MIGYTVDDDLIVMYGNHLGMGQGLRRLGSFVGLILGPMWGGATVHYPLLQMGVPLALLIIMAVSLVITFVLLPGNECDYFLFTRFCSPFPSPRFDERNGLP